MADELLSVILCNYNHASYVGEALQAILNQNYSPLEIIVVDDGSTDESVKVIRSVVRDDPRVKFLLNEQNRGLCYSLEYGISVASGSYLYTAAADDRVLPGLFEKSMRLLLQYPKAGLCCSDPAWLDGRTLTLSYTPLYWSASPAYLTPDELAGVMCGGYIPGHTSILRRSAWLDAGKFIPELKWHTDVFTTWVIGFRHGVCYIPEPLASLRVLPDSFSNSGRRNWSEQKEVLHHLLTLFKSPQYRDILPHVARSSLMSCFNQNTEIVRMVMSRPEHWDATTMMLIQDPLLDWCLKLRQTQQERHQNTARRG